MSLTVRRGFTLIEMMIVLAIIGLLSAIAIPNFIRMQAKSKQAEVKSNLKALFTGQKAYYQANDTFSNLVVAVGFEPERGNRYCYDLGGGGSGVYQTRSTSTIGLDANPPVMTGIEADTFQYANVGISSVMPAAFSAVVTFGTSGTFSATAVSNIDADSIYDQWSVSSITRSSAVQSNATTACSEGNNPGGEPCNDVDDVVAG